MTLIWGWLTSKLAGPVATGAATLLLVTLVFVWVSAKATEGVLHHDLDRSQAALLQAQNNLTTCRTNVSNLQIGIDAQNAAVTALQTASDKVTASAKAKVSVAQVAAKTANERAAAILAEKPISADQCVAADSVILDSLK